MDHRSSSAGPLIPEAVPHGFWHAAKQSLLGVLGLVLITFAAVWQHLQRSPPETGVGPGTISLLYLIVVVFVSLKAGFASSVAVSLIAVFCLNYFFLPLVPSLQSKNPLDIVATVAFLITAWVITGMVARMRQLTEVQLTESRRAEQELRQSFAQLRALAARLQTVREDERTRAAREIHDELGQALTAIKLEFTALLRDLPAQDGPVRERSQTILKLLDQTFQSVRRIATGLRPTVLDDLGLVAALEWAAEDFQARTGTRCEIDLPDEDIVLDPERATALFRIFQETLTNVARHANATHVNARLAEEGGSLILEVRDNGKGIGEEQLSAGTSLGILGLRERVLLLGGTLTITGTPEKGTAVTVHVPDSQGFGIAKKGAL